MASLALFPKWNIRRSAHLVAGRAAAPISWNERHAVGADAFEASIPALDRFDQAADSSRYVPLPDNWFVALSDVVDSTSAIAAGQYKAVNLAGAATISGVANALGGKLSLFAFAGDGAHIAVPPDQAETTATALLRVARWVQRDLNLELRVGMVRMSDVRRAGFDVKAAFWQASDHVRYAMFTGGGLDWADERLKDGQIRLPPAEDEEDPDLTGLSCQWGPILPRNGRIVSLIVKRTKGAPEHAYAQATARVLSLLADAGGLNPVPVEGPAVPSPRRSLALQSRIARGGTVAWRRYVQVLGTTVIAWLLFRTGLRVGRFDPTQYRREMAANSDFMKYDDGLLMTIDCSEPTIAKLRETLNDAEASGVLRFGLHIQHEALLTCIAPVVTTSAHMHFVDGADGGYASAARMLHAAPVSEAGSTPAAGSL